MTLETKQVILLEESKFPIIDVNTKSGYLSIPYVGKAVAYWKEENASILNPEDIGSRDFYFYRDKDWNTYAITKEFFLRMKSLVPVSLQDSEFVGAMKVAIGEYDER